MLTIIIVLYIDMYTIYIYTEPYNHLMSKLLIPPLTSWFTLSLPATITKTKVHRL